MKQIRKNVFETNSSSTHSITICTNEEFCMFESGEMLFDTYSEELVMKSDVEKTNDEYRYQTYYQYIDDSHLEMYDEHYTSPSGDRIVAFGKYGYDG